MDDLTIPQALLRPRTITTQAGPNLNPIGPAYILDDRVPASRKLYPLTARDLEVIAELQAGTEITQKTKAANRIAKMKARFDGKAITPTMRWDTRLCRFVDDALRPSGINATRRAQSLGQSGSGKYGGGCGATRLSTGNVTRRGRS